MYAAAGVVDEVLKRNQARAIAEAIMEAIATTIDG